MDEEQQQPEKKTRMTAAQRFPDVPEVTGTPKGSVGHREMAERLGLTSSALSKHMERFSETFPTPVGRLGRKLFHDPKAVEEWNSQRMSGLSAHHLASAERHKQGREARVVEEVNAAISTQKSKSTEKPSLVARMTPGTGSAAEQIAALDKHYGITEMARTPEEKQKLSSQFDDLFFGD